MQLISIFKSCIVAYSYNPRTWEVEAGGLGNDSQSQLHSLSHMRSCLTKKKKKKVQKIINAF